MNEQPLIDSGCEKILSLPTETQYAPNGIVSRTLLRTANSRTVLFGFAEGQELTEHTSTQHAVIQILSGSCEFSLSGVPRTLKTGDLLYMPPNLPHAVKATEQFSMLLTLSKPARIPDPALPKSEFKIIFIMSNKTITVDVRDDIRSGREPFSKIMKAAAAVQADESLLVIAPFEPVPLFRVLEKQGFVHTGQATPSGDWEILFKRQPDPTPAEAALASSPVPQSNGITPSPAQIVAVDARGLEPPQPMIKILEALVALPAGAALRARTERRPMHLYPHLEERGFTAATEDQSDGSFLTHISR